MKKLLSFALVLAMVVVLAAPALAITGSVTPQTTAVAAASPFKEASYGFTFITYLPSTPLALLNVQEVAANKAFVQYETLTWRLNLVTDYNDTTMNFNDYGTPGVRMTSDVVNFTDGSLKCYAVTNINVVPVTVNDTVSDKNVLTFPITAPLAVKADNVDTNYVFVGTGIVAKAVNGYVKVEVLGHDDGAKFMTSAALNAAGFAILNGQNGTIYTTTGAELYRYAVVGDVITVSKGLGTASTTDDFAVDFVTNGNLYGNNVTAIRIDDLNGTQVLDQVVTYVVPISGGGAVVNQIGGVAVTNAAVTADLAAYNEIMNFFGFNYNAEGTLLPINFAVKLSTYYWTASKAVNLYTAVVTIPDTTVPPKTGDNASVLGFVMVAAALVAVVAMGYKKVTE